MITASEEFYTITVKNKSNKPQPVKLFDILYKKDPEVDIKLHESQYEYLLALPHLRTGVVLGKILFNKPFDPYLLKTITRVNENPKGRCESREVWVTQYNDVRNLITSRIDLPEGEISFVLDGTNRLEFEAQPESEYTFIFKIVSVLPEQQIGRWIPFYIENNTGETQAVDILRLNSNPNVKVYIPYHHKSMHHQFLHELTKCKYIFKEIWMWSDATGQHCNNIVFDDKPNTKSFIPLAFLNPAQMNSRFIHANFDTTSELNKLDENTSIKISVLPNSSYVIGFNIDRYKQ